MAGFWVCLCAMTPKRDKEEGAVVPGMSCCKMDGGPAFADGDAVPGVNVRLELVADKPSSDVCDCELMTAAVGGGGGDDVL